MTDDEQPVPASPPPPGPDPRDGLIDFSNYSDTQLQDLRYAIDADHFPRNFSNLQAELKRRQTLDPAGTAVNVTFTRYRGVVGWIEAKLRRLAVFGRGSIEVVADEVVIFGWQQSWLWLPTRSETRVPIGRICNVSLDETIIEFQVERPRWLRQHYRVRAETTRDAAHLAALLPDRKTKGFGKKSTELRAFNRRLVEAGRRSWVTPAITLANVAMFVVMTVSAYRGSGSAQLDIVGSSFDSLQLTNWGANFGPFTVDGQWWRLLTATFIHLNLAHLALNMWAFWSVGRLTERLYGSLTFLSLYLVLCVLASLSSILWNPGGSSVGASGAICGVFGAFLAYLIHQKTKVPSSLIVAHWLPALLFITYGVTNGILSPGVDNAAHIGGLISGLALGWILARPIDRETLAVFPLKQGLRAAAFVVIFVSLGLWQLKGLASQQTDIEAYFKTHDWFTNGEAENLRAWHDIGSRVTGGTISSDELSRRFETEILPFWQKAAPRLKQEQQEKPDAPGSYGALIASYAQLRLDWATALAESAKHQDAERRQDAVGMMEKTTLMEARIERLAMRSSMDHRPSALSNSLPVVRLRQLFSRHKNCVTDPFSPAASSIDTDSKTDGPAQRHALACAAQRLFLDGDYASLDAILKQERDNLADLPDGSSSLSGTIGGLADLFANNRGDIEQMLGRTSDWRRMIKGSIEPDLVEAALFREWAWVARGAGKSDTVSAQASMMFAHRSEMAGAALDDLADRGAENPLWYELSLQVGTDGAIGEDKLREIFEQGHAKFPTYLPIYARELRSLAPRWGGSYEKVDALIRDVASRSGPNPALYAQLYWSYADIEWDDVDIFRNAKANWPTMKLGFFQLLKSHADSDLVLNAFARFACQANDIDEYFDLRPELEGRTASAAWTTKITIENCDKQIGLAADKGAIAAAHLDQEDTPSVQVFFDRARADAGAHNLESARAEMDNLIQTQPDITQAYFYRSMIAEALKDSENSLRDLDHAIELSPRFVRAYALRSDAHRAAENDAAAKSDLDAAIKLAPYWAGLYVGRAEVKLALHDADGALADAKRAVELDPELNQALFVRGLAHDELKDFKAAVADYREVIARDSKKPSAYETLGRALFRLNKFDEATEAFAHAVELAPDSPHYLNNSCYHLALMGRYEAALKDCNKGIEAAPKFAAILDSRAYVYLKLHKSKEAVADFNAAVENDPKEAHSLYGRGLAKQEAGDTQGGAADIEAAVKMRADIAEHFDE
jgi:membrane associated rhomboid family serine protease/tetratricopeptide (TPR) repeat protein